jgi:hypothetical protein
MTFSNSLNTVRSIIADITRLLVFAISKNLQNRVALTARDLGQAETSCRYRALSILSQPSALLDLQLPTPIALHATLHGASSHATTSCMITCRNHLSRCFSMQAYQSRSCPNEDQKAVKTNFAWDRNEHRANHFGPAQPSTQVACTSTNPPATPRNICMPAVFNHLCRVNEAQR